MPCLGRPGVRLQSPGCCYCSPSPIPPCSCPSSVLLGQQQVKIVGILTGSLLAREDSALLGIPSLWPLQTGAPVILAPSTAIAPVSHGFMVFASATSPAPSRGPRRSLPGFAGFLAASCRHLSTSESEGEKGEKVLCCVDYCVFVIWNGISCRYSISQR